MFYFENAAQVVCLLIRCCDVSSKTSSSVAGQAPLPNTLGEPCIVPIQPQVAEMLYRYLFVFFLPRCT